MKILILFAFVLAFGAVGFGQTDKELIDTLRERVVGKTNQSIVVALVDAKGVRFISDGKTADTATAKNSDESTVFEIGSITKVFTGTLLAEAVRRGEVRLDDPISKFLPKTVKTPVRNNQEITLLDLATQSSGLPSLPANFAPQDAKNPYLDYTVAQMYDFLSNYHLTRDIGAKYEYSNLGMGLLGHILSLRAKKSYEDLVKERILNPLGMNDTSIALSPSLRARMAQGYDENGEPASNWDLPTLAGAGALRSTAKDMAKFIQANINSSNSDLTADFSEATQPRRAAGSGMQIGLAWHILTSPENTVIWHNGGTGGFRSFAGFNRAQKKGIVVLTNTSESVDDIGLYFLNTRTPLKKIKPFIAVSEKNLDDYLGIYELAPNVVFTITRTGDKLFAQLTNQEKLRVFAESENRFYYKPVKAALTFNRGAGGKVESLTLSQNGEHLARKIK